MGISLPAKKRLTMRASHSKIYSSSRPILYHKDLCAPEEMLTTVTTDFEGRSVQTSKFVLDDPRERNKGYKPSDFALENQISVGVPMKPAFCSLQRSEIDSEINRVNNTDYSHEAN